MELAAGGVAQGVVVKSKNSVISICAASRLVKFPMLKRVSTNLSHAVSSATVCETKFFFEKGEITSRGTRYPVKLKSQVAPVSGGTQKSFVCRSEGGIPSGLVAAATPGPGPCGGTWS